MNTNAVHDIERLSVNSPIMIAVQDATRAIQRIAIQWPDEDADLHALIDTLRWLGESLEKNVPLRVPSPSVLYQFALERADLAEVNTHGVLPSDHDGN